LPNGTHKSVFLSGPYRKIHGGAFIHVQHERALLLAEIIFSLIKSFLQHTIYEGGFYTTVLKGISLGCPLSPLLGALFLKPMDDALF
jgi:hypothetical protein